MHREFVWECSVLSGLQEQKNKPELPRERQLGTRRACGENGAREWKNPVCTAAPARRMSLGCPCLHSTSQTVPREKEKHGTEDLMVGPFPQRSHQQRQTTSAVTQRQSPVTLKDRQRDTERRVCPLGGYLGIVPLGTLEISWFHSRWID